MGKCLYEIKECEYKSDGMCSYRCSYEEKENANSGYPLLGEVFNVYTINENEEEYSHWSEGLTMIITKNGTTIKLNSEEIEQIVKTLPRTIGGDISNFA